MPQMAPLNWLLLFTLFSLIFMIFSSINYFFISPSIPLKPLTSSILPKSKWLW